MQKILLIGELNDIARSLNECLADDYQVQLCSEQIENVQAMIKIFKPDLIIISQIGEEETDTAVFQLLQEKCSNIPVLGITTTEGWKQCRDFYKSEQFDVLFRPVAKYDLLEKCRILLSPDDIAWRREKGFQDFDQRKKIMIVDDSALMLRSMKSMLEKYYDICLAKSGEQALKLIPRENPDLVLLDYEMQGMDGKDTIEAMKEDEDMRSIPVVFLTSISDRGTILSVLKSEPDGYILKPPDEKRIRETIEEIFAKKYV